MNKRIKECGGAVRNAQWPTQPLGRAGLNKFQLMFKFSEGIEFRAFLCDRTRDDRMCMAAAVLETKPQLEVIIAFECPQSDQPLAGPPGSLSADP